MKQIFIETASLMLLGDFFLINSNLFFVSHDDRQVFRIQ